MTITLDTVRSELEQIITEAGPESAYQPPEKVRVRHHLQGPTGEFYDNTSACEYVHEDPETGALSAGCIVGIWAHRFHAVDLDTLYRQSNDPAQEIIPRLIENHLIADEIEHNALILLRQVQIHQDNREMWFHALREAVREVEEGDTEEANEGYDEDEYDEYPDNDDDDGDQDDQDGFNDPDPSPRD